MEEIDEQTPTPQTDPEFIRLPGLFRRWEIEQVLEPGSDFHLEEAGDASDGSASGSDAASRLTTCTSSRRASSS